MKVFNTSFTLSSEERCEVSDITKLIREVIQQSPVANGIALINTCASVGGFVGPYAIGFLRDRTGGGNAAGLVFLGVLLLLAAAATLLLRRARALAD